MTLLECKKAVSAGRLAVSAQRTISAKTDFQKRRLTKAVDQAVIYLHNDFSVEEMAKLLDVTKQRAQQILKLGINHMQQAGWLRPVGKRQKPAQDQAST